MNPKLQASLRVAQWFLLGGWLGSWAFFAFVTARVAFRVLPSSEMAGLIVAPTLQALHLYGLVAGLGLAAIGSALRWSRGLIGLTLLLALLCAVTEFGVSAAIENVRPSGFGPDTADDAALRFRSLHAWSMGIFSAVLLGVFALTGILSWRSEIQNRDSPSGDQAS